MKLCKFLSVHNAEILAEWDRFAWETAPAGSDKSKRVLRNHAAQLLIAIADNMELAQSGLARVKKSRGHLPRQDGLSRAANIHGMLRHHGGFHMKDVAAEFRALRASVLRLWLPTVNSVTPEFSNEVTRFNEAIDEALSDSINTFSDQTSRIRDTFLAVLGHDLRNPLSAIAMNGAFLRKVVGSDAVHSAGSRIVASSVRMGLMINDLLEYGRTQLVGHLALKRHVVDMQRICQGVVDEACEAHPEQKFALKASGDLIGSFDEARLQQVFANLLCNAAHYSERGQPIEMAVEGLPDAIAVKIHNVGPIIPSKSLKVIFDPMVQLAQQAELSETWSHSVGLGLYIAREFTAAHGGSICVKSSKRSGTVFTVVLPRTHSENHELHIEASA